MSTFCKRIKNDVKQEYEELKLREVADYKFISILRYLQRSERDWNKWNDKQTEQHIKSVNTCPLCGGNWETDVDSPSATDDSGEEAPPRTTTGFRNHCGKILRKHIAVSLDTQLRGWWTKPRGS